MLAYQQDASPFVAGAVRHRTHAGSTLRRVSTTDLSTLSLRAMLRDQVRRELAGGVPLRDLAQRAGVAHPAIIGVRDGTNALTKHTTVLGLCGAFKREYPKVLAEALEWGKTHPRELAEEGAIIEKASIETRLEPLERYPNFEAAAGFARAMKITEAAIGRARAAHKSDEDLPPETWLDAIKVEQALLNREAKAPPEAARRERAQQAAGEAEAAELRAKHEARVAARDAKAKAKKKRGE